MLWMIAATQAISYILNLIYTNKLFNYTIKEQLSDIIPNLSNALFVGGVLVCVLDNVNIDIKIIQILFGAIVYILLYVCTSVLLKFKSIQYLKSLWA